MADATPVRPHYLDRQFLNADDFTTEQQYHLAMLRRHRIAQHTAGTVSGLDIGVDADSLALFIGPGVGIDCFGRELIVTERLWLPSDPFPAGGPDAYDVMLLYDRVAVAVDDGIATRWVEQPRVALTAPTTAGAGPPPPSVLEQAFGPADQPPDDPVEQAPLFAGQIRRPDRDGDPPIIDQSGRPWVGLTAGAITAPQGTATIELGGEDGPFSVSTGTAPDTLIRRLGLDPSGLLTADGALTVAGQLAVGGQVEFQGSAAQPGWGLQLVRDDAHSVTELRIQMDATDGSATRRTVIGCWGQSGSFTPLLSIADDGTVTVHGDMIISGTVHAAGGVVPAQLSDQASQFAASALVSGVGAAASLLDKVSSGAFAPRTATTPTAVAHTANQLVAHLEQDLAHAETFAEQIKQKGAGLIQHLISALERV
jgi:hypothetical protein